MSKVEKTILKWRNRPNSVEKTEVLSILARYGFSVESKSGSHLIVSHPILVGRHGYTPDGCFCVPIKSGREVKGFYIKAILEAIDIMLEEGEKNETKTELLS